MFKHLRVNSLPNKLQPALENLSISQLIGDANLPVTIKALNSLPENPKLRLCRTLIPIKILSDFAINPRTWKNPDGLIQVKLIADYGSDHIKISAWHGENPGNEFFYLELADNVYNGIDLNFVLVSNPMSERFGTDFDEQDRETLFGTVHRNLLEEEKAMRAGLAPGQIREGLHSSQMVINHIETFLTMMAHHAFFLEPLTYVSALIFEKRGFAYAKGHHMMDNIHREFQPGGKLNNALDGSSVFRQPDQWKTMRGRAWAIHDGILDVIDGKWDGLKMIKQVGRHAGVETFPNADY